MSILSPNLTPRSTAPGKRIEDPARFPNPSSPIAGFSAGAAESDYARRALPAACDDLPGNAVRKGPDADPVREFMFQSSTLALQPYQHLSRGGKK